MEHKCQTEHLDHGNGIDPAIAYFGDADGCEEALKQTKESEVRHLNCGDVCYDASAMKTSEPSSCIWSSNKWLSAVLCGLRYSRLVDGTVKSRHDYSSRHILYLLYSWPLPVGFLNLTRDYCYFLAASPNTTRSCALIIVPGKDDSSRRIKNARGYESELSWDAIPVGRCFGAVATVS